MTIKVFISHQKTDSDLAIRISARLRIVHQIESYLDVIDPNVGSAGEELAEHVHAQLSACTQLLAVVSEATKGSWWVPWEIGIATEKQYPLATFSGGYAMPPEYLRKWPYLRSDGDLDQYALASKLADRDLVQKRATLNESTARGRSTRGFYTTLRASLGQ